MDILRYIENQKPNFIKILKDIVTLESPTLNKDLNDLLADYLEKLFLEIGSVSRIKQEKCGDNLRIEFGRGEHSILILCHMDTVWDKGEIIKRPFKIIDNKIIGPGVYDMKFGIVQAFFCLKTIIENKIDLNCKVIIYINSDEETGSFYSEDYIKEEAIKSKSVIVLEPSEESGYAKTQRKGMANYTLSCYGKSAHSGAFHQDGRSAIKELAKKILEIENLTDYKIGITSNVGIISGGKRVNVVPDEAVAHMEFRFKTKEQWKKIAHFMKNLKPVIPDIKMKVTLDMEKPPLEKTKENQWLYKQVQKASANIGIPMGEISAGGLSDGNATSYLGIPTIDGMGAIGMNSHSVDEYVRADKITERIYLLLATLKEIDKDLNNIV